MFVLRNSMSMIVTIFAYFLLDKSVKCDEQKLSHLSRKNAKNQSNLRDVWYQCLFHSSKEKGTEKRLFTVISISFFFNGVKTKFHFNEQVMYQDAGYGENWQPEANNARWNFVFNFGFAIDLILCFQTIQSIYTIMYSFCEFICDWLCFNYYCRSFINSTVYFKKFND